MQHVAFFYSEICILLRNKNLQVPLWRSRILITSFIFEKNQIQTISRKEHSDKIIILKRQCLTIESKEVSHKQTLNLTSWSRLLLNKEGNANQMSYTKQGYFLSLVPIHGRMGKTTTKTNNKYKTFDLLFTLNFKFSKAHLLNIYLTTRQNRVTHNSKLLLITLVN